MQAEDEWRGAIVLGSHRSGTSAVTGVIDALGLPACREEDRFEMRSWSALGLFEAQSLSLFDEALLIRLGGAWWAPPLWPRGWTRQPAIAALKTEAAYLFAKAHPARRWVWKDPRACVLMPFWDEILGDDCPRIVVLRNPLEVAASLNARNFMPEDIALAMTERNLRTALRDSNGRAVWITTYNELLNDFDSWCSTAARFLRDSGLPLAEPLPIESARAVASDSFRHHRATDEALNEKAPVGLRRIWSWALARVGVHASFSTRGLPRESSGTAATITKAIATYEPLEDGRTPFSRGPD